MTLSPYPTQSIQLDYEVLATDLAFAEGPVSMKDGSVIIVEIGAGCITRIKPDGSKQVMASPGGGPNGAAIGPDGALYVCNNGGMQIHRNAQGMQIPGDKPDNYSGGRIERIDLDTGAISVLYQDCGDIPLNGPNDIVFDDQGGFWFTDLGKSYGRVSDRGALFYAKADGSSIHQACYPFNGANGVGLSPDGKKVYVADTPTGRLWAFDIVSPGKLSSSSPRPEHCLYGAPGYQLYDSLAVDSQGNVCVATIINGGITSISMQGHATHYSFPDMIVTNICFDVNDPSIAYVTLSSSGKLIKVNWPTAGLALNYNR